MDTKHHKFSDLVSGSDHASRQRKVLYECARSFKSPMIVELGTASGESTTCFLTACEENGGRLVSVDIADCSDVSNSPLVTFVRADAADVAAAAKVAPVITEGIDLLYIDALHTVQRVQMELEAWFPLLNEDSVVMFDDVDASPYRRGARKDNWRVEDGLDAIHDYLVCVFNANSTTTELSIVYGSTGLAQLKKHSAKGTMMFPPSDPGRRSLTIETRRFLKKLRGGSW